mgnify:CR=1 FL=1
MTRRYREIEVEVSLGEFSDEELEILNEVESTVTYSDCVELTKKITKYMKEEMENEMDNKPSISNMDYDESGMEFEQQTSFSQQEKENDENRKSDSKESDKK